MGALLLFVFGPILGGIIIAVVITLIVITIFFYILSSIVLAFLFSKREVPFIVGFMPFYRLYTIGKLSYPDKRIVPWLFILLPIVTFVLAITYKYGIIALILSYNIMFSAFINSFKVSWTRVFLTIIFGIFCLMKPAFSKEGTYYINI